ncbi:hypothetical protein ACIPRD_10055 [Streptomyces sp. NPDC090108]|uniref:DUF7878 domain-containing protein n=1 Tax=Streptomyces sp. NPDC090108 TaxID=3365947 RepID=UPI00381668CF
MSARESRMPVEFVYQNLGMPDLIRRGMEPGTADAAILLVDLEADLVIRDGAQVVFAEGLFPVAELARALAHWLRQTDCEHDGFATGGEHDDFATGGKHDDFATGGEHDDFAFDSMSYAEVGIVRITESEEGWRIGSVAEPHVSSPVTREVLTAEIRRFVTTVREDITALGVRPDLIPPV